MSLAGKWKTLRRRARRLSKQTARQYHLSSGWLAMHGLPLSAAHRRLLALRGIHQGKTAFIVGNGPSVRLEDLERLNGEITFCFNRFYLAYEKTRFRPAYYMSGDRQMVEDFGAEMLRVNACPVIFATRKKPVLEGDYFWVRDRNPPMVFEPTPFPGVCAGGSSPIVAIQLAYFMGIKQIYLYGVDHSVRKVEQVEDSDDRYRTAKGEGNHFLSNYYAGKSFLPPIHQDVENAYRVCDAFLRSKGGWIKNATRTTYLPDIERVSFDELALPVTSSEVPNA